MLQQLNVVGDSCKSTFVIKKKADILSISNCRDLLGNTVGSKQDANGRAGKPTGKPSYY